MKKKKLVYGVGINDADYVVKVNETIGYENGKQKRRLVWLCPFYGRWVNMLARCYSTSYKQINPTYEGCSVCEEWLRFSNFRAWMEKQDWEGKHLDKDLLNPRNKVYSPEACVFVDERVNIFLTECSAARGEYMIGVYWDKSKDKFRAVCRSAGKSKHLGCFGTEIEAHKAWLAFKLKQAKILAAEQTDPRVAKALIDRYQNYIIEE